MRSVKANVDQDTCIGCTICTQTCPEVFRMEEGKSRAYVPVVPEGSLETCRQAAEECPVSAINLEE